MPQHKPMEFWIDSLPIFNGDDIVSWKRAYTNEQDGFEKHKGNELYHVIEYSAYEQLKAENEKLKKENEGLLSGAVLALEAIGKDYAKLKAQDEKLVEALEALEDCIHTLENSKCDEPEWARSSIELGKKILKDVGL